MRVLCSACALLAAARPAAAASLASLQGIRGGSQPQQLIAADGSMLSAAGITGGMPSEEPLSVVASVGGKVRGRRLLNALFETSFATDPAEVSGAWVASSPSVPGLVTLDAEDTDECALGAFSLSLADAVLVHSPCTSPSPQILQETFERLFVQRIAALGGEAPPEGRTMLVLVQPAAGQSDSKLSAEARSACERAWAAASAPSALKGVALASLFEVVSVALPSARYASGEYEAVVSQLRTSLRTLRSDGFCKGLTPEGFAGEAEAVWTQTREAQLSPLLLRERFWISSAYATSYAKAKEELDQMAAHVAASKIVSGFGASAAAVINSTIAAFDAKVADCGTGRAELAAKQRERLEKALSADVGELFRKQHRLLTLNTIEQYKEQLKKVMARAGNVQEEHQARLRRNAEKAFDAQLATLIVPNLLATRGELCEAFSRTLTMIASKFVDSPAMQLQAIGATRRKVGKGPKPPPGLRWGLGLVGAVRPMWGGGQGNLQSFVGYVDGLNSAHLMVSNDGAIPDSTGNEPPPFRFQPKLNFDVSI